MTFGVFLDDWFDNENSQELCKFCGTHLASPTASILPSRLDRKEKINRSPSFISEGAGVPFPPLRLYFAK